MKIFIRSLAVLALFAVTADLVYGVNPDSFEISVTPNIVYSVLISTPEGGIAFTSNDLNTAYVNAGSATVTNNGNIVADWTMKATALNTWTLGTTLSDNGGDNKMVLAAQFNGALPLAGDYVDADVLTTSEKDASTVNFAGTQNGDDVAKTDSRLLWIYVKTPTNTTVEIAQKFRVEVKAYPASRF
ncbi:MAG: hypothetical protein A2297_07045 [Elusimicrobia bacterium RIFOXYB2_FULL_48_7]|nr:MAG: hypothetical protein A2297_07045 [Elusimicrobia bacterium RIFOXYB2_FULL_48_7]